ncbi:MAG: RNAseH domain-containing protein [Lachnospiraceae bacterium]|nr:RNAseH domain-containing protein [Lachnospiraceae bacterium]
MSNYTNIYPMAFVPNSEIICKLYYVGFPQAWKEKLIQVERIVKPKWNGVYALPTYALKNSLGAWLDGIIDLTPLRMESNDEMWAISCEQEINTQLLFEHIVIWLHSYYLSNPKLHHNAKIEIQGLIDGMSVDELNDLVGNKTVRLFDAEGIPTENYSYSAFSLMITNALVGKSIVIDGHDVVLNYAGKNQLISDLQGEGNNVYSYGVSFSLQTVPPERKSLLLCDCCIHRWIPSKWKDKPYLNKDNMMAHVWVGNNRIYKLPIFQKYKTEEEYYWQEVDKKYYNLYNYRPLPTAREVIDSLDKWMTGNQKITFLYKNGMNGLGFTKNSIGTGVSVIEKKDIFDGVLSYIAEMVYKVDGVERVKRSKNAMKKLKLDEINFNKELTDEQRFRVASRIKECIEDNRLNLEVYYRDDAIECAKEIMDKFKNIFQTTEEMVFDIKMCQLGKLGEALDNSESASVLKRIKEIEKEVEVAKQITACIVLLPGKDKFVQGDPKDAMRCGFALRNRLTQFITPWNNDDVEKGVLNKITSAIEDLCRQLGYVRGLDAKVMDREDSLVHTPIIGMHVMTQIKTIYGKARFLPLCVQLDYISGKIYVECDAFEQTRVPYHKAAFELARLSLDKDFEKKCDDASKGMFKQKMVMWKNVYKNNNLLVLIEANGNTRAICNGITDGQIQKYTYQEHYCPEEIEVGTKESSYKLNLNDSGVRFIRIRRNGEVPDYYTDLSKKEGYSASSGVFRYGQDYWSVAGRPNDKVYKRSYKNTKYNMPTQNFAERDMIEIYPIQLQKGDNPDEWVNYTDSLRLGAIQYDEATIMPIPIHLASKLQEYILEM